MPERGISFARKEKLLSIEEMKRLSTLLTEMGIEKIRLTGGEPFVRENLMELVEHLSEQSGLKEVSLTTNATLIGPHIEKLNQLGVHSVNVSLDAITPEAFHRITRKNHFDLVYHNLMQLIQSGMHVRINCIVLEGQNESEILPLLKLQEAYPISVRFLEEMPFNGGSKDFTHLNWNHHKIIEFITSHFPKIEKLPAPITSTAVNYKIPGHSGSFGIIPSFSRTFCGSCNRLRITATGDVITCLYGKPVINLKQALRSGNDKAVIQMIQNAVNKRARDGFEAQEQGGSVFGSSMTSIGG
jgi:cyclic pyranopterin phosphate synthase